MSCAACAATIAPDSRARGLLAAIVTLLTIVTVVVVPATRLPLPVRITLIGLSLVSAGRALFRLRKAVSRIRGITLAKGGRVTVATAGADEAFLLLPGSFLAGRLAWLRMADPAGGVIVELLTSRGATPSEWRRFRALWRWGRASSELGGRP